ncbi:PREDICTED: uncharacterized protein LOC105460240 [Wasmannia auropunctata]|uniref:uncharacterized protein LOC105460240 n=1 Tax=Wasmannia auropunctata TaxID=64793 RepID=UPI0005F0829D|nr:PREDICTED: uncharacterized protein LOC105460240 [Wasmannia auropunctata]
MTENLMELQQGLSHLFKYCADTFIKSEDDICLICFEKVKGLAVKTKCNHLFCKSCLDQDMEIDLTMGLEEQRNCPTCRTAINRNDFSSYGHVPIYEPPQEAMDIEPEHRYNEFPIFTQLSSFIQERWFDAIIMMIIICIMILLVIFKFDRYVPKSAESTGQPPDTLSGYMLHTVLLFIAVS